MNTTNFFIRLYYTSKPVLFTVCACQEAFYGAIYLMHWTRDAPPDSLHDYLYQGAYWAMLATAPLFLFKQAMNFLQMKMAVQAMNAWEEKQLKKEK